MHITPSDTQTLQRIQLLALLEIKRICNKYNIRYFLQYGTLLGAVRHKGFIPWDDDLDIAMLRSDYDCFIDACKNDLSGDYFLQIHETDKEYAKAMIRICVNDTEYVFNGLKHVNMHQGIFVDIFPIDNAPKGKTLSFIYGNFLHWLQAASRLKLSYGILSKIAWRKIGGTAIYLLPLIFFNKDQTYELMEKTMKYFNGRVKSDVISSYCHYSYKKNIFRKDMFDDVIELTFEGFEFSCPKNYHEYLSQVYGDYMTPPPKDQQKLPDSIIKLDFGKYSDSKVLDAAINNYKIN